MAEALFFPFLSTLTIIFCSGVRSRFPLDYYYKDPSSSPPTQLCSLPVTTHKAAGMTLPGLGEAILKVDWVVSAGLEGQRKATAPSFSFENKTLRF